MRTGDIPAFLASAKAMNFQIVAVSDIWMMRREDGAAYNPELTGQSIDAVVNNEALYARKDIDAVLIATPTSKHAQHGIQAVLAAATPTSRSPLRTP